MLRCSAEAFARCPTRHLCGRREDSTYAEGSECDKFNQEVASKPMTNGDKFRNISDPELAKLLISMRSDEIAHKFCNSKYCDPEKCESLHCSDCIAACVRWLQSPAEVPNGK